MTYTLSKTYYMYVILRVLAHVLSLYISLIFTLSTLVLFRKSTNQDSIYVILFAAPYVRWIFPWDISYATDFVIPYYQTQSLLFGFDSEPLESMDCTVHRSMRYPIHVYCGCGEAPNISLPSQMFRLNSVRETLFTSLEFFPRFRQLGSVYKIVMCSIREAH